MADSRAKPQRFGPKMGTCAPHGPKMVHVAPHMLRGLFVGAKAGGFRPGLGPIKPILNHP